MFKMRLIRIFHFSVVLSFVHSSDYKYDESLDASLKLHIVPARWHDAMLHCRYEGALLMSPTTPQHAAAMTARLAGNHTRCGVFTGVHATFSQGDYFSMDGVPLDKIPIKWAPDEPDNFKDGENCLIFLPSGTMADVNCSDTFPYICIRSRHNKPEAPCMSDQYKFDARTGSCYKFHNVGQPWSRAFSVCAAEGAHLAVINSDAEAQVLKELFAQHPQNTIKSVYKDAAAIGFQDWDEHGIWYTIFGESLEDAGYAKWGAGQPDNTTKDFEGQYCGAVFRTGLLDDIWCGINFAFICEKGPLG